MSLQELEQNLYNRHSLGDFGYQLRKVILDTNFIHNDFVFVIDNLPVDTSRMYQLALRHMDFDNPELRIAVVDLIET